MEKVKIIYEDGAGHTSKKIGLLKNKDDSFLTLLEEPDNKTILIPIQRIIRIEVMEQ